MSQSENQILINAIDNAAASMNMMLGSEVKVSNINFSFKEENDIVQYSKKIEKGAHVLKTDMMGNLVSTSYLVMSPTDVNKIFEKCLPGEALKTNNSGNLAIQGGFLLELDNIVAAGAITVFANQLDETIYGDVPKLLIMNKLNINEYIDAEIIEKGFNNCINAVVHVENIDIELDFIWLFDDNFFKLLV
ncbi:MAG: hypothetical protein OEW67_02115 [Cyclobacteriaceae bacterium]|nr:hypothetical protein [Cyclobacteriaceae bacterium]